jgi:hypothetical protein
MAHHFKIEQWKDQKWFAKVMKEIERGVKHLKDVSSKELEWIKYGSLGEWLFLPTNEYRMDNGTERVLGYRSSIDMELEPDKDENQGYQPHMKISQLSFEIHVDKNNKIQQVYVPL